MYTIDVQSSLQTSAVGVATGAEDVEVTWLVVGLGLGLGNGNGKMGNGMMMTKSSFSEVVTASVLEGTACRDSQLKVVS